MNSWLYCCLLPNIFLGTIVADIGHVRSLDVQQDERIRLECTVTSKLDAEEAMWMRIRPPHNPDILTYRDSVVYAPDRIQLEQRRLSSSINDNGTFVDTYFLTLTILRPQIDDEGRYICSRGRNVFAEYDLFIIVPPQFVDDNTFIQQRTVIEGSTLQLSCSAQGRPKPSITWFYRTNDGKHVSLGDSMGCQNSVCELRLGNYSRNDPTIIECVADNEKSTRISKVFHVDVHYPPNITTEVRALTGSRSVDIFVQCHSISNPPASVSWFDDRQQEINNPHIYHVLTVNQSSILSFSVSPQQHAGTTFRCRSNNSIGIEEKIIDVAEFVNLESIMISETTTMTTVFSSSRSSYPISSTRRSNSLRGGRVRSRSSTTVTTLSNPVAISSSNSVTCPSSFTFKALSLLFCMVSSLF